MPHRKLCPPGEGGEGSLERLALKEDVLLGRERDTQLKAALV
jgi:hypothetical protein